MAAPGKTCSKCLKPFSGFGSECPTCRPLLKKGGSSRACAECGAFFFGFKAACEDCMESGENKPKLEGLKEDGEAAADPGQTEGQGATKADEGKAAADPGEAEGVPGGEAPSEPLPKAADEAPSEPPPKAAGKAKGKGVPPPKAAGKGGEDPAAGAGGPLPPTDVAAAGKGGKGGPPKGAGKGKLDLGAGPALRKAPAKAAALTEEEKAKKEEARKAREAELRKKEEEQRAALAARAEHYASLTPADITTVPWSKAVEINMCDGGSGGALLVDLTDQCVVLKRQSKTACNEMLAQHIAVALDVPIAMVRIVRRSADGNDEEFNAIREAGKSCRVAAANPDIALWNFFGLARNQNTGEVMEAEVIRGQKMPGTDPGLFGVLEYVPGNSLMGVHGNQALAAADRAFFVSIGKLCSFDVLINNLDRIPLPVWSNDGNMGNVMVTKAGHRIVGIDQQVNLVKGGAGLDKYIERVRKIVADVGPGGDPKDVVAMVRTCLADNCGHELSGENAQHICQGLRCGFESIAKAWKAGSLRECIEKGGADCLDRFTLVSLQYVMDYPLLDGVGEMQSFVCRIAEEITAATDSAQG